MHSDESNTMMRTGDYAYYDKSASKQDKLLWWSRSKPYDFALYYDIAQTNLLNNCMVHAYVVGHCMLVHMLSYAVHLLSKFMS